MVKNNYNDFNFQINISDGDGRLFKKFANAVMNINNGDGRI